jgi:hypothetical protein
MVRKLPVYMTEILLEKGVKWNKQTNFPNIEYNYCVINVLMIAPSQFKHLFDLEHGKMNISLGK